MNYDKHSACSMRGTFIKEVTDLIAGYLANKLTDKEKKRLFETLGTYHIEKLHEEKLLSLLNDFKEDHDQVGSVDFEEIYNKLRYEIINKELFNQEKQRIQKKNKIRRLVFIGLSSAAIILIAFFLGTLISKPPAQTPSLNSEQISEFTVIKAPLGAKSEIIMNDGTEVMLNAGSTIKYNNEFNAGNRDITLEGEAYFKVARNEKIPLVVSAGNLNIKATGTEFNLKAYSEDGIIETTLIEGEIEISQIGDSGTKKTLVLKPNQKAIYTKQMDQLIVESKKEIEALAVKDIKIVSENLIVSLKTDVEQVTAWTRNKLIIRSENLESLCTKLQRKYNVTFVFRDEEIKKYRFTGVLLDETFTQVMDVIKLTAPVDYEMDGRTVYLYSKKTAGNINKNQ